jgi:hypothetical protein
MQQNRVPLVCLVLLALTTSAFVATRLSNGQASQTSNQPLKMKVLRDKAHVRHSPGPAEVAAFKKTLPQEENERKLEDTIPKHVPIKIKIKKEKEAGFKDLNNERWAREFELEVTNTGTKPIYYIYLYVITDVQAAAGFRIVFPLYYGRPELSDISIKPDSTDIPIKPGESVSLKIHPSQLDAWDLARQKENRPFPKHLQVKLVSLSFGDHTGFVGSDGQELPLKMPEEEGAGACLRSTDPFGWKDAPPGSALSKLLAFNLPVATWPVSFFADASFETTALSSSLPQTCCSGSNCSIVTVSQGVAVCINCPPQNRVSVAICSDPNRVCRTTVSDYIECFFPKTNDSYFCQTIDISPCGATAPSPSPSPTPSPTPTPTPCPMTIASECPGGVPRDPCTYPDPPPAPGGATNPVPDGCPFGYQVSGLCCVPIECPKPTPTPPTCPEGEVSFFNGPPICQWSDCFKPFPLPEATPTPTPVQYKECVDYYWVWFVSYDGGKTWQPTGEVEYAGCYYVY